MPPDSFENIRVPFGLRDCDDKYAAGLQGFAQSPKKLFLSGEWHIIQRFGEKDYIIGSWTLKCDHVCQLERDLFRGKMTGQPDGLWRKIDPQGAFQTCCLQAIQDCCLAASHDEQVTCPQVAANDGRQFTRALSTEIPVTTAVFFVECHAAKFLPAESRHKIVNAPGSQ